MNIDRLQILVELALNGDNGIVEWRESGLRVTVTRNPSDAPTGSATVALGLPGAATIVASMFGQFHLRPETGAPPFVSLGDRVEAGQRVGLIEAMKTFFPVVTARVGRIVEILVEHGAEVSLGQPLFYLEQET